LLFSKVNKKKGMDVMLKWSKFLGNRRLLGMSVLLLSLVLSGCNSNGGNNNKEASAAAAVKETRDITVRIGFQKYGTINILKADGALDKRLAEERNIKIEWIEFPGGPQLLEALNVGSLDLGHTGEAPPIFAQAAGAPLVYLAHEPASPKSEGIIVPKDSPIKTVADHYLLVKLLEQAGVEYKDVNVKFLPLRMHVLPSRKEV
jgi:sulfonate transport system substrate-binding protein